MQYFNNSELSPLRNLTILRLNLFWLRQSHFVLYGFIFTDIF